MVELALAAESAGATIISTFSVVCVCVCVEWGGRGEGRQEGWSKGGKERDTIENIEREKS